MLFSALWITSKQHSKTVWQGILHFYGLNFVTKNNAGSVVQSTVYIYIFYMYVYIHIQYVSKKNVFERVSIDRYSY